MSVASAAVIALAGAVAGLMNAVVGSGTLVTFPVLLALGYPPVTANVSNNLGLVFGAVTGTWGYRRELRGQGLLARALVPMSAAGAVAGAVLLLRLPSHAFDTIVPALVAIAMILVVLQPRIAARAAARRAAAPNDAAAVDGPAQAGAPVALRAGVLGAGVYGGYFGAAQGVLLIGLLGSLLPLPLQQLNGIKNLLGATVNGVAALAFLVLAPGRIDWAVTGVLAGGAIVGGFVGARVGRRLPASWLRAVIVLVGALALWRLL